MSSLIITGIGKNGHFTDKKVYVGIDGPSGYPYWSPNPFNARQYSSMNDALSELNIDYLFRQAKDITVATFEIVTTPVKAVNADTSKLQQEITELQQEVETNHAKSRAAIDSGHMGNLEIYGNRMQEAIKKLARAKSKLNSINS